MYRVLLADDEQIERMALAKRLKRHFGDSLKISEAVNGVEALDVCKREKSQIVIMDISMPEMNGVEAAEHIREQDEDCIIIFLTAYDEFSYAKRAIVIRALDYLLKPCEEEELVAVMEEAMRLTDRRGAGVEGGASGRTEAASGRTEAAWGRTEAASGGTEAAWGGTEAASGGTEAVSGGMARGIGAEWAGEGTYPPAQERVQRDDGDGRMAQVAETIREYIRDNYMKERSMQDAARMMNYSDAYFCKLFKQCFDQNFTSYLAHFRINEAKRLMKDKRISVKDVSLSVGYYDSNYFAKVFKRITGMIPSEYRDSENAQK